MWKIIGCVVTTVTIFIVAGCQYNSSKIEESSDSHSEEINPVQYRETTLASLDEIVLEWNKESESKGNTKEKNIFIIPPEKYSAVVVFEGKVKELPQNRKDHLAKVGSSFGWIPQKQWRLYTHEIEVSENGKKYMLPIQSKVLDTLLPALKEKAEFVILFIFMGAQDEEGEYLINAAATFSE